MSTLVRPVAATRQERRELVEEILASERFRRSKRLSEFLRYVVDAELSGSIDTITEQHIGQSVYGKPPGYNAAEENVVRVDARRLRVALEAYFNTEGPKQSWILEIPRGHYVPVYRRRQTSAGESFVSTEQPMTRQPPVPREIPAAFQAPSARLSLLFLGVAIGVAAGVLIGRGGDGAGAPLSARSPLLAAVGSDDRDTLVVVADSQWSAVQSVTGLTLSLSDYLDPNFRLAGRLPAEWVPLQEDLDFLGSRQFVPLSNVHFLKRLIQAQGPLSRRTSVKFARHLRLRDLQDANVIFLGSSRSIPWVELFEDKVNFVLKAGGIENRRPQPNEQEFYVARKGQTETEVFAHIAAVPNLNGAGQVLIVEGTGLEGTEAAANFVLDPNRNREIVERASVVGQVLRFELLLRSHDISGAPSTPEVVALRLTPFEEMSPSP